MRFPWVGSLLIGAVMLAAVLQAAEPQTTVSFAPAVAGPMAAYGEGERATLESTIETALAGALRGASLPSGLTIHVTLEELAPSHPTRAQLMTDPAMDPTRTHFLGGAALSGEVRDASGRVLSQVSHRYYPPTIALGSASLDPWADARLAIDQFAAKLAAAARASPRS